MALNNNCFILILIISGGSIIHKNKLVGTLYQFPGKCDASPWHLLSQVITSEELEKVINTNEMGNLIHI